MSLRKVVTALALAGAAFLGSAAVSAPAHAATSSPSWHCYGYEC
jgi:hypothetical protein